MNRIYLDNAATSWPKPEEVYRAVDGYLRTNGAPAGRSAYSEANEVEAILTSARASLSRLIGANDARQIIFTANCTEALNLAIHGLLRPGDHAICTAADHNSVLRPLKFLEDRAEIKVTRVPCDSAGLVDPDDVRRSLQPNTWLVAMTQASNVTGVIEPVSQIGSIVKEHGAKFLVDAAQSLGHLALHVDQLHADLLAAPGHKGMLGPLGTGFLYIRAGLENEINPLRQGGTGTDSGQDRQPDEMPYKFETGNHNVPGLVGLAAALKWLESRGPQKIYEHEHLLANRLREGLQQIPGITLYGCSSDHGKTTASGEATRSVGVVSVSIEGYDPQEAAVALDANFGIQVRAGFHCAPLIHRAMGTFERGGAVRFSIGAFNSNEQIDAAIAAVAELAKAN
jgi:cysteine desulfurase / selenocysteine lyase